MSDPIYTARARVEGGRGRGRGRTEGGELDLQLRLPPELGGDGDGANPEQLLAIAYAACFEAAMAAAAKRLGIPARQVDDVAIDAAVSLVPCDDGTFVLAAALDVDLPSLPDRARAVELVRATHAICPYSKALRASIDIAIAVDGVALDGERPETARSPQRAS